jgi:hypothetical protein
VATTPWSERFPLATIRHLTGATFDHCPIFLRWKESARQRRATEDKIFRYELMWKKHESFKPFLDDKWQEGGKATTIQQLKGKLDRVSGSLEHWGSNTFGHVRREIQELNDRLTSMRTASKYAGSVL